MMGVKTPRDKMVRISNKGNIVDEDIFLMWEIIVHTVNFRIGIIPLNFPINSFNVSLTLITINQQYLSKNFWVIFLVLGLMLSNSPFTNSATGF